MFFGSVKNLKTVRFLERQGSRYRILTENGSELCTVRFAPFKEKKEHGRLFGAVWLPVKNRNGKRSTVGYLARYGSWLKTETENGVFLLRFSLKNGKRYGFRLRRRGFLSLNFGNGRSRNGRVLNGSVRYRTGRVKNSDALL